MAKLVWTHGERELGEEPLLVGRDPIACDVAVEGDSLLSRIHFALVPGPGTCFLLDLRSSNGTYVNEARVHYSRIQDGDQIQAGSGCFTYRDAAGRGARWSVLPEPQVSLLARADHDPLLTFLRTLRETGTWEEAMEAAARGVRDAAAEVGVTEPAAFAFGVDGDDPVCRAISGAPPERLAELVGPLLVRARVVDRPFLVEEPCEQPGFLPPGYPVRVQGAGSLAAVPLGPGASRGFLCLAASIPGESLGAEHLTMVEAFAHPLDLVLEGLAAKKAAP